MFGRGVAGVFVALSIAAAPASAQSLADVARQEEARRATVPKAAKSYSNADLGPGEVIQAIEPEVSCYMSVKLGRCVSADEILANTAATVTTAENASKEPALRSEAESIRRELAYLETEINALTAQADNENLPAPKRELAEHGLAMKRPQFDHVLQRWAKLEKQIRDLRFPHEWIEPVPPQVSNPH